MRLKVCGMRDHGNILQVVQEISPDFMGFICYKPSPRYIGESFVMPENFPESVKRVGVFVDEPFEEVMMVSHRHNFDAVQLHGAETPEYCRRIRAEGKEVIKVFRIMDKLLQKDLDEYGEVVDYFLFDTFGKHYGGTGKTFDWNVLKGLRFDKPVFMSGGIDNVTVRQLVELPAKMYAVDVNSGYEEAPALKNIDELKKLKNFLRNEL